MRIALVSIFSGLVPARVRCQAVSRRGSGEADGQNAGGLSARLARSLVAAKGVARAPGRRRTPCGGGPECPAGLGTRPGRGKFEEDPRFGDTILDFIS